MRDLLGRLLSLPPLAPAANVDGFFALLAAAARPGEAPVDAAIVGGYLADRLGYAFVAGYRAALHALVPAIVVAGDAALCVTEEGGAHPRAIATTLRPASGGSPGRHLLSGRKKWITLASRARRLLVAASTGRDESGRNRIRVALVDAHAPGVALTPMPPTPFVPEIDHAEVSFTEVALAEEDLLPGDGYERYVKRFRTVEDIHVHAALAGHLLGLGRAHRWPRELLEDLLALLAGLRALAAEDPAAREIHVALAGVLRGLGRALGDAEPHWPLVDTETHARFERDRPLLQVAARARAERREVAWRSLDGA